MRIVIIGGLLLLAVLLPMAALPLAIFVIAAPLVAIFSTILAGVSPRSAALPALADPRAPPSL